MARDQLGAAPIAGTVETATTEYVDAESALKLAQASNLSDLASASTARTNLGLGTAAVVNTTSLVTSLAKTGSAGMTGDVTLTGGTNVTLTQSGSAITIASSGGTPIPDLLEPDAGVRAETFPWILAQTSQAFSSQACVGVLFRARENLTVTQVASGTGATAAATITGFRMGLSTALPNGTLTLVARTALSTTVFAATNTRYALPFDTTGGYPSSYSLVAGNLYAAMIWGKATTMPKIASCFSYPAWLTAHQPVGNVVAFTQTDIPTTMGPGNSTVQLYLELLP